MIQLDNVEKVFLTDEVETHALSGVNLEIHHGINGFSISRYFAAGYRPEMVCFRVRTVTAGPREMVPYSARVQPRIDADEKDKKIRADQVRNTLSARGFELCQRFQPRLEPQTALEYKPAVAVGNDGRQFVITDGRQKVYHVALGQRGGDML